MTYTGAHNRQGRPILAMGKTIDNCDRGCRNYFADTKMVAMQELNKKMSVYMFTGEALISHGTGKIDDKYDANIIV